MRPENFMCSGRFSIVPVISLKICSSYDIFWESKVIITLR
jgi:hypothetical protein